METLSRVREAPPSNPELDRTTLHPEGDAVPEDLVPAGGDSGAEVAGPGVSFPAAQSDVERYAAKARAFTVSGFRAFFFLTNRAEGVNLELPKHAVGGVAAALKELQSDSPVKICIWEWHRESAKSTVATTLAAWLLGHRPSGTVCVFHANEDAAKDMAEAIADRIDSPVYSLVFPHVQPDKPRGWGNDGYEIVDKSMTYDVWMQEAITRITPSIVGLGIYSAAIRGKRATLLLLTDDVVSDAVAVSQKEQIEAGSRFDNAIMPLRARDALALVVGTPQVEDDILGTQKKRGVGSHVFVPMWADEAKGITNWPEWWSKERANMTEKVAGAVSWARNYLLDLKRAGEIPLSYFEFPADNIDLGWVASAGVDYASQQAASAARPGRSHYAIAYLFKRPTGGVVVYDGIIGQFSQEDCEFYTAQAQTLFNNFRGTVVESIGKGEEHFNTMMRKPGLKLVSWPFKGQGRLKSKPDRLVRDLGPYLQRGDLLLSSANTEFLKTAKKFAERFPAVHDDEAGWDVWDSIFLGCQILLEALAASAQNTARDPALPKPESPWGKLAHSKL